VADLPKGSAEDRREHLARLVAGCVARDGSAVLTVNALALVAPALPSLHCTGPLVISPAALAGCFTVVRKVEA
jgi:hypothetical protein